MPANLDHGRDGRTVVGLDLGSNTFSCAALRAGPGGSPEVVQDTSRAVRLSQDLEPSGPLSPMAIARGLETIERLAVEFHMASRPVRAVGTAALRLTGDPTPFVEPAEELIGARIEIIDGIQEALLVSRGAVLGLSDDGGPWLVIDVGGRSTEICCRDPDGVWNPVSLPIGVVDLMTDFLDGDPPSPEAVDRLRARVRGVLGSAVPEETAGRLVGVAGTASTLGRLEAGIDGWDRDAIHGIRITRESLRGWLAHALELTTAERMTAMGLGPARADVFPAGLCVLAEAMSHLGRNEMTVSANGLRIGAAMSLLEEP